MLISVFYIRVNRVGVSEYQPFAERFLQTYQQFRPGVEHELVVVDRYMDSPDGMFDSVASRHVRYDGGGQDCGAWVEVGTTCKSDLIVCLNATVYFHRDGWLRRLSDAALKHGHALYGAFGSYEISPHIRTSCLAFQPDVMSGYDFVPKSKADGYSFEHGPKNFTRFCNAKGLKTMLVTWDGEYGTEDWLKPVNTFRQNDQSNCIMFDRHCDLHFAAHPVCQK